MTALLLTVTLGAVAAEQNPDEMLRHH